MSKRLSQECFHSFTKYIQLLVQFVPAIDGMGLLECVAINDAGEMTTTLDEFAQKPRIAYFSMEVALDNGINTYAGGLGILAGDTVRSAADLNLPMVTVSLVSKEGYFRQELREGRQVEHCAPWQPQEHTVALASKVAVPIAGRLVWIGGWLYTVKSPRGYCQPVILLDTNLPENEHEDRSITNALYGGDAEYRLKQEIVLGIGGARLLQAVGIRVLKYHMNEGHAALLALELLRRFQHPNDEIRPGDSRYDIQRVRSLCDFTTHTPVEAGHDRFDYDLVDRLLPEFIDREILKQLAGTSDLNMTLLALNLSEFVNGVAERHAEVSRRLYPHYHVRAITNGVHPATWTCPSFAQLYDRYLPGWAGEPTLLMRADSLLPNEAVHQAHADAREALMRVVRERTGVVLDPRLPILGFARRMTTYKRPDLLFADTPRLSAIAAAQPFQVVLAGKAHPHDEGGKKLIERLNGEIEALRGAIRIAYLPDYDMTLAALMVSGSDVWLNTPLRPLEASGTSGMKAAFNGVPSLSVLDGWWLEGCIEGVTGWAIGSDNESSNGDDVNSLYTKLAGAVLPRYYGGDWVGIMKGAIAKNASFFNSHRMMRRYAAEAYIN
jgi:starch phosphorylase